MDDIMVKLSQEQQAMYRKMNQQAKQDNLNGYVTRKQIGRKHAKKCK